MFCENCGKDHDGVYGSGRFCTSKCSRSYASKSNTGVKDVECVDCGCVISVSKQASPKLCKCDSCRLQKKYDTSKYCINCGNTTNRASLYCSNICKKEYLDSEFVSKWKSGEVSGNHADGQMSSRVRSYIFDKYNHKCRICGWAVINPITNKIPLQINHIDGCSENSCENNLELLCPNCHSLTDTFGSLNRGNGRKFRKR